MKRRVACLIMRLLPCLLFCLLTTAATGYAQTIIEVPDDEDPSESTSQLRALDERVQKLKQEVIELNRDLFVLEEELLFPSNTQVSIFVSVDVGKFFNLDSVQIKLDGEVVTNYLYTQRELEALHRGGVHRIHTANLRTGDHEMVALIVGTGPKGRDYRRGANIKISKGLGPKYLELQITDQASKQQPEFIVREW